mgnify:CR=1 FL=1
MVNPLKVLKYWKSIAAVTVIGQAQATDRNVLEVAIDDAMAIANVKKQDGETTAGAVARSVVDTVTSKGTTDKALERLRGTGRDMSEAAHNMAEGSRSLVSGTGDGMMGGISNLFSDLTSGISNFLGGGSSGLNFGALAMLPLAWFTFGKFGWIGKIGAFAMLMYGLSNMFRPKEQTQAAALPARAKDDGRQLTPRERYDALEKEQQKQDSQDDAYNVRATI